MESKYKEFADLLFSTYYNNFITPEEVKSKVYPLREWIKNNLPSKLYRYRAFNTYSIEALKNDEIWGSSIVAFNDPYECLPCYNIQKVNAYIDNEFSIPQIKNKFQSIKSRNAPSELLAALPNSIVESMSTGKIEIPMDDLLSQVVNSIRLNLVDYWQNNMVELENRFFNEIVDRARMYHIACFSETNLDNLMWSHYANSHTGFCIEYDIKSVIHNCSEACQNIVNCSNLMLNYLIAPVIYQNDRYDASSSFMSLLLNWTTGKFNLPIKNIYYDMLAPIKTMLVKSKEWGYEKEWRLFLNPNAEYFVQHKQIIKLKPSAIYMGTRINTENMETLQEICREKQIPCYPMMISLLSSKFECIPSNNTHFTSHQDSAQTPRSETTESPQEPAPACFRPVSAES